MNNTTAGECAIKLELFLQSSSRLTDSSRASLSSFAVLNGFAAMPTFLVNLLVMWTVLESHRLRSSSYNILVAVLSLSDMLTGLLVQPLFVSLSACYLSNCSFFCELRATYVVTGMLTGRLSLVSLALVSLERYLNIQNPLTHSNSKIVKLIPVGWFLMILTVLLQNIQHAGSAAIRKSVSFVIVGPVSAVIVFCSLRVYATLRRQRRAVAAQIGAIHPIQNQSRKTESKRSSSLLVGLLAYGLLYLPLMIVKVVAASKAEVWARQYEPHIAPLWVTCLHLQSLVNPLIYAIRLSDIRRGVKRKIPCLKTQQELTVQDIVT